MNLLRILVVFVVLIIISIVLQLATVPFSATHNTFDLLVSFERSIRGVILGGLIWSAVRLIRGDKKSPEISLFIFYIAVLSLVLHAIYDLVAS